MRYIVTLMSFQTIYSINYGLADWLLTFADALTYLMISSYREFSTCTLKYFRFFLYFEFFQVASVQFIVRDTLLNSSLAKLYFIEIFSAVLVIISKTQNSKQIIEKELTCNQRGGGGLP